MHVSGAVTHRSAHCGGVGGEGGSKHSVAIVYLCTDVCGAVTHLLTVVGYEGKVTDRLTELPHVLMETDPEDIQWLKVPNSMTLAVYEILRGRFSAWLKTNPQTFLNGGL